MEMIYFDVEGTPRYVCSGLIHSEAVAGQLLLKYKTIKTLDINGRVYETRMASTDFTYFVPDYLISYEW